MKVRKVKINVPLTYDGITDAYIELAELFAEYRSRTKQFRKMVADEILKELDAQLAGAWHNDLLRGGKQSVDIPTFILETENSSIVVLDSDYAVFVEFGAGIHHNRREDCLRRCRSCR